MEIRLRELVSPVDIHRSAAFFAIKFKIKLLKVFLFFFSNNFYYYCILSIILCPIFTKDWNFSSWDCNARKEKMCNICWETYSIHKYKKKIIKMNCFNWFLRAKFKIWNTSYSPLHVVAISENKINPVFDL